MEICKDIPQEYYSKTLCRIKKLENNGGILIDNYIKDKSIGIRDCKNPGIEEVPDLDNIYENWLKNRS